MGSVIVMWAAAATVGGAFRIGEIMAHAAAQLRLRWSAHADLASRMPPRVAAPGFGPDGASGMPVRCPHSAAADGPAPSKGAQR